MKRLFVALILFTSPVAFAHKGGHLSSAKIVSPAQGYRFQNFAIQPALGYASLSATSEEGASKTEITEGGTVVFLGMPIPMGKTAGLGFNLQQSNLSYSAKTGATTAEFDMTQLEVGFGFHMTMAGFFTFGLELFHSDRALDTLKSTYQNATIGFALHGEAAEFGVAITPKKEEEADLNADNLGVEEPTRLALHGGFKAGWLGFDVIIHQISHSEFQGISRAATTTADTDVHSDQTIATVALGIIADPHRFDLVITSAGAYFLEEEDMDMNNTGSTTIGLFWDITDKQQNALFGVGLETLSQSYTRPAYTRTIGTLSTPVEEEKVARSGFGLTVRGSLVF